MKLDSLRIVAHNMGATLQDTLQTFVVGTVLCGIIGVSVTEHYLRKVTGIHHPKGDSLGERIMHDATGPFFKAADGYFGLGQQPYSVSPAEDTPKGRQR